jgi:hypothetical protein
MTQTSPSSLPSENLQRGVIFALIALPAGVIAWDLLWSLGFIASIVSFGIAFLAERLYRFGSGGRLGRSGAIAVAAVTIGTLIIAVISGFAVQIVGLYSQRFGTSIPESLLAPRFWSIVFASMTSGQAVVSLLLAAAFAVLGCFRILSTAFRQTRVQPTMDAAAATADPSVPAPPAAPQGLILNGEPIPPTDEPRDSN